MSELVTEDIALRLSSIKKRYGGVVALDGVSIDFPRNSITAIVGDNGAGKSTTLKIISGAEYPDSGEIHVNGQQVRFRAPEDARQVVLRDDPGHPEVVKVERAVLRLHLDLERQRARQQPDHIPDVGLGGAAGVTRLAGATLRP